MKKAMAFRDCKRKWSSLLAAGLLIFTPVLAVGGRLNSPLSVASSNSLVQGDFAYYTESNISLNYMVGYQPSLDAPNSYGVYRVLYLDFKTSHAYSSLTVGWDIEAVRPDSYLVNYSVVFRGMVGGGSSGGTLSEDILVSRDNNTAYWTNGTAFGTWPYWLAQKYLVPGSTITIVHRVPEFIYDSTNGTNGLENFTEVAFTSLPQGTKLPNQTATQDFLESSLNLGSQGTFLTDRIIVTYPFWHVIHIPGNNNTVSFANSIWVGAYDRFSGILLAQDHDYWFIDDLLLHSGLGVWQVGFHDPSLILSSTNLDLNPDTKPGPSDIWIAAAIIVALIGSFGIATILTTRRRQKSRVG